MAKQNEALPDVTEFFSIPKVSSSKKYWLVRTNSGEFYRDFTQNNYIAIGWDYVTIKMMQNKSEKEIKSLIETRQNQESATNNNSEELDESTKLGTITAIYNKIYRFVKELSIGDIVIIPSANSDQISIGVITSDIFSNPNYEKDYLKENPETEIVLCTYHKRRHVEWLKTIRKAKLDIYLSKVLASHHAISSISDYAMYVDRAIYDIYEKDNKIHAIFHTTRTNGITLHELRDFFDSLSDLIDDASANFGIDGASKDIEVKLNIHSPGIIEIATCVMGTGIALSGVIFALGHYRHGGKINATVERKDGEFSFHIDSESKGTLQYKFNMEKLNNAQRIQKESDIIPPKITAAD